MVYIREPVGKTTLDENISFRPRVLAHMGSKRLKITIDSR